MKVDQKLTKRFKAPSQLLGLGQLLFRVGTRLVWIYIFFPLMIQFIIGMIQFIIGKLLSVANFDKKISLMKKKNIGVIKEQEEK